MWNTKLKVHQSSKATLTGFTYMVTELTKRTFQAIGLTVSGIPFQLCFLSSSVKSIVEYQCYLTINSMKGNGKNDHG